MNHTINQPADDDSSSATRAVVEALAATLEPGQPLPHWARLPRTEAEFVATLIGRTDLPRQVTVHWEGDQAYLSFGPLRGCQE